MFWWFDFLQEPLSMLEIVQFKFNSDFVALVCYRHEKKQLCYLLIFDEALTSAIKNSDQRSVSKTLWDTENGR